MEIFDSAELLDRDAITEIQLKRLKTTLARTRKCDFYKKRLADAGIGENSISSPDALENTHPPNTPSYLFLPRAHSIVRALQ